MSTDIDVLVLGGSGVDTIVYVPELPLAYADSYMVPPIEQKAGQTGDNVALGVHALGLATHHIDLLGADHEGDLLRALHRDNGIPFTDVPVASGTKRAVNLVGPDGRRLSLYDATRGEGDDRLPPGTVRDLARRSRHAHVSITYPCGHALPILREAGVTISTDLHNWDGVESYHETFAYAADIVILSATALADPHAVIRKIADRGRAQVVVATDGARGSHVWADGEITHVPAVAPADPVVDSNGAGDAFVSGFLFGWLDGQKPLRSAFYGALAGAYACTIPATRTASIGRAELLDWVARLEQTE
ncbi:adenosine kinase [Hamadaea tsunoensis]|uniref:adenosine kinase n=1 Tax=Hamadaea tsunoensis TaxID=53368 RepID=UPI000416AF6F|nr:adenosine kinase [Hamadaea tsunoensis]